MIQILEILNRVLGNPTKENILALFDDQGFIRFNMIYISPIALKQFKNKLFDFELLDWFFTDSELIFKLKSQTIVFKGNLSITYYDTRRDPVASLLELSKDSFDSIRKSAYTNKPNYNPHSSFHSTLKIFSIELDFDPLFNTSSGITFLNEVENFLKHCDSCFFMTYPLCNDSEFVNNNAISKSVKY